MLKYLFFLFVFKVLGLLPLAVLYRVADAVGNMGYLLFPGVRANVWDNLRHVYPPGTSKAVIRRAARQVFRTVALYYADMAYLPRQDVHDLFYKRMVVHGMFERLIPAAQSGTGVIMMSAHFGNPELGGQGLIPHGVRVFALTEPLEPPQLLRMLDRTRSSKGHTFAPVSVGSVKRVMRTLKQGGVVVLMGDRDIEGPRMRVPFLGVEASMPTGPIEVALRTGATVIPSFCARKGRYGLEAFLEEPLKLEKTGDFEQDVRAGTLEFLSRFEKHLRADPGQWGVFERVWDGKEIGNRQLAIGQREAGSK
ncbi:MAG TPA: lysophospholipid acyltransferase family protein [Dehalococcoidia bacterium]|nr:lysophospholipid acyltransferase family protein [Dehalococcoidia bacterium]